MDATKKPLRIPPQFGVYAEKHDLFEMFRKLVEDLLIVKPDDPLQFLQDQLKRDDNDVPAIIIQGPTASGKTTIAKMICKSLRTAFISADSLLSDDVSTLAAEAKKYLQNSEPIPMDLWIKLLQTRLKLYDCVKKGWVLEGFPETREQALALQAVGITAKHYVVLDAPDTVLIERQMGKRIDPKTKEIFHTTFDCPSNPEVDGRLIEPPEGCNEADTAERLVLWHRNSEGLLRCYQKFSKTINADQPKADVFAQVLTFLKSKQRSLAPHTPRVVLLGPTGSGKGVQAALLASKYNLVNVSSGQLVKEALANGSKVGEAMKPYIERGMMVPDNIMVKLLDERLSQVDCTTRGWVLRGFPRTREQAENLSTCGHEPNRVFFLDVPNDSVFERLTLRSVDAITGQRYHALYNPPRTVEIKDRGLRHPKDTEEDVRERLSMFHAYSEEISDFYESAQHINGDQDPHTVFECVESMLVNPIPKKLDPDE